MKRLIALTMCAVSLGAAAQNDWDLVFEDEVLNVAFGENDHFLNTRTSVFRSSDDGVSWTECNWTLGIVRDGTSVVQGLSWNDDRLIVAALDNGYFLSTDLGESFEQTGPTGYGCASISIIQLPGGEAVATMGGFQRGLWKCGATPSTSWSRNYSVGSDQGDLQLHGDHLYAVSYSSNHPGGVLRSSNFGESWELVYSTSYFGNPRCYVILEDLFIYVSQEGTLHQVDMTSWTEVNHYDLSGSVYSDLVHANGSLYAASADGIMQSDDMGQSWMNIGPDESSFSIVEVHDGLISAAGASGLWSLQLEPAVLGCTDESACNFDAEANSDDGTCVPSGCLDADACNYNADAECEGEACDYNCCPGPGCCGAGTTWNWQTSECDVTNPSDSNFDGCVQLNDLLDLLSAYGDCGAEESAWQCNDPLEYQGYYYETVQIGEQCWFAENLRAENYRNGDEILSGVSGNEWQNLSIGASAIYGESDGCEEAEYFSACDPDESLSIFGRLYNWFPVGDSRGLCPAAWHVPTDYEWYGLDEILGGGNNTDEALKSTFGWNSDNGTNSSGFRALPSGQRDVPGGDFKKAGSSGGWWSSTEAGASNIAPLGYAWTRLLTADEDALLPYDANKKDGFSIRCIKDSE